MRQQKSHDATHSLSVHGLELLVWGEYFRGSRPAANRGKEGVEIFLVVVRGFELSLCFAAKRWIKYGVYSSERGVGCQRGKGEGKGERGKAKGER